MDALGQKIANCIKADNSVTVALLGSGTEEDPYRPAIPATPSGATYQLNADQIDYVNKKVTLYRY